jgi:hypothetical protein
VFAAASALAPVNPEGWSVEFAAWLEAYTDGVLSEALLDRLDRLAELAGDKARAAIRAGELFRCPHCGAPLDGGVQ